MGTNAMAGQLSDLFEPLVGIAHANDTALTVKIVLGGIKQLSVRRINAVPLHVPVFPGLKPSGLTLRAKGNSEAAGAAANGNALCFVRMSHHLMRPAGQFNAGKVACLRRKEHAEILSRFILTGGGE
jgi:hypothetical protein